MTTTTHTTTTRPRRPEQIEDPAIRHYTLEGTLPAEHALAVHTEQGTLALVGPGARVLHMQMYTPSELAVLVPLLTHAPAYAPYEVLYAHFYTAHAVITQDRIDACREHLYEALAHGSFEAEMRPLRNVMSRVRLKLHAAGIDVLSLIETGYVLCPWTRTHYARQSPRQPGPRKADVGGGGRR